MLSALLADRSEQQPGEPTVPARTYDEQVGAARLVDQHPRGRALDNHALQDDAVPIGDNVVQRGIEKNLGVVAQFAEVSTVQRGETFDPGDADVAEPPSMHGSQRRLSAPRLLEREPEGLLGSLRAVNADDDHTVVLLRIHLFLLSASELDASRPAD